MTIKLAFLGTGTCNRSSRNPQSLVFSNGSETVLVDCGGGCYHQLSRLSDSFFTGDSNLIFLTHYHIDHVSGLLDFFWGEMYNSKGKRAAPLTLAGPPGLVDFFEHKLMAFLKDKVIPFEVKLVELTNNDIFKHDFFTASAHLLQHGSQSTGYLFDFGSRKLAVSGDTGYCASLVNLLQQSDLAVLEWSDSWESDYPEHISNNDIKQLLADDALPERVYIVHMYLKEYSFPEQVAINKQFLGEQAGKFFFPNDLDVIEI